MTRLLVFGAVAIGLFGAQVGCHPEIPNGVLICTSDDECPPDFTCRFGEACYRQGTALTDLDPYERCTADSECASGICAKGLDMGASVGQCSNSCTKNADCVGPPQGVCVDGSCLLACMGDTDKCKAPLGCFSVPGLLTSACFQIVASNLDGRHACTSSSDCPTPGLCLLRSGLDDTGVCTWECAADDETLDCPLSSECTTVTEASDGTTTYPAIDVCLAPCETSTACDELECGAITDGTGQYCLPAGWSSSSGS